MLGPRRTKARQRLELIWAPYLAPDVRMVDIARKAGVEKWSISRYLHGERVPDRNVGKRVAKAMGMTYEEFLRRLQTAVYARLDAKDASSSVHLRESGS